jgi:hypothetical protein
MKRAPTRNHGLGAKAAITLHSENHTRLSRKARRRPIRSARRPNTAAPMNMPRNDEASNSSRACPPRPYCVLSAVAIVLDRKISYTSKKRPSPIATTTLRCIGPIGRWSRRRPMSVSIAWRSAGEGGAIFASILIDLHATIGETKPTDYRRSTDLGYPSALRYALVEGLAHVLCRRLPHRLRCAFCQCCPVAVPDSGRAPQHASTAERLRCRAD